MLTVGLMESVVANLIGYGVAVGICLFGTFLVLQYFATKENVWHNPNIFETAKTQIVEDMRRDAIVGAVLFAIGVLSIVIFPFAWVVLIGATLFALFLAHIIERA